MNSKGFTLLEVLISVSILAIAIVTLITTHNRSLDLMYTASMMSRASLFAKEIMEKSEIEDFSSLRSDSGQFDEDGTISFGWERAVSKTQIESLKKIEVVVSWSEGKGLRKVKLVSFIAKRQ